jgi:hypothetical protein
MSPPDPILIIAHAQRDRRGRYAAEVAGEIIVPATRMPFLAACRELVRRGYDPTTRAVMRHAGSTTDSLSGPIGEAAKLTVRDSGWGPKFGPWREGEADSE